MGPDDHDHAGAGHGFDQLDGGSSAAVMWPVASTMGKDVDTVTPGVIEVPGSGAYENRDRLRGSEARLNKLTA